MKILFLCASLERGRDGVGDYTRRLALECIHRGHTCTAIALHDPHLATEIELHTDHLRILRLGAGTPWSSRLDRATAHARGFQPDWISWQLVSYGFHPKGILPTPLSQLARRLSPVRHHTMLHELWIGLETTSSVRDRLTGFFQRFALLRFLDRLRPARVHTSNVSYQQVLARHHRVSEILPLFGNVPVVTHTVPPIDAWSTLLPAAAGPHRRSHLIALTFGTLHPQWNPDATIDWLHATARRLGRIPALVALGRTGPHSEPILSAFKRAGIIVQSPGEQASEIISRALGDADLGIAPHPWALIGKSGAAAAMLDHGLPVVVPRDEWRLRIAPSAAAAKPAPADHPLLARLTDLTPERTDPWLAARRAPEPSLPRVAEEFIHSLNT